MTRFLHIALWAVIDAAALLAFAAAVLFWAGWYIGLVQ